MASFTYVLVPKFIQKALQLRSTLTHLATVRAAHDWSRKTDMAAPEQLLYLP